MQREERPPTRSLVFAFGAVVICFVSTTAYSEYRSVAIGRAAGVIADRASPAIEHLAAARAELRQLDALVRERLRGDDSADLTRLHATWEAASDELRAYDDLPRIRGNNPLRHMLRDELGRLTGALEPYFAAVAARDDLNEARVAHDLVRPAIARSTAAGLTLLRYYADSSRRSALRIERVRASAMWIAFVLDGAAGILTALTAWLLIRSLRHHAEMLATEHQRVRDKSAELEMFSARVAHDLAGPISAAMMALDLTKRLDAGGDGQELVGRARRSLLRATEISRALLAFARSGARPEPDARADAAVAVAAALEDVQLAAAAAEVAVRADAVPAATVACSQPMVVTLLTNLLQNAVKYVQGVSEARVVVRVAEAGARVRFEVEDNGVGLPPGIEAKVFEPFVRGDRPDRNGVGLGLATVKRVALSHGGDVGVVSRPGLGCTFWFELPRAA